MACSTQRHLSGSTGGSAYCRKRIPMYKPPKITMLTAATMMYSIILCDFGVCSSRSCFI